MMSSAKTWEIPTEILIEERKDTWDFCPQPIADESFLSWFTRLSKENCSDMMLLYQKIASGTFSSINHLNQTELERKFKIIEIEEKEQWNLIKKLSPYCDISHCKPISKAVEFFLHPQHDYERILTILPAPRYCPICLKKDKIPFFRAYWFYPFITYCDKHQILLSETCPHCYNTVKFWASDWNLPITNCFYCKRDILENQPILSKISANFQTEFYNIVNKSKFNGRRINPEQLLYNFWKVMINESKDPLFKSSEMLIPVERMFKTINIAYHLIDLDNTLLDNHHYSTPEGLKFPSRFEYDLHNLQQDYPHLKKDEKFLARCNALKPYFKPYVFTKTEIFQCDPQSSLAPATIYNWVLLYNKEGIRALVPKQREKGKRTKRFTDEVYQILEEKTKKFDESKQSMQKCWKNIVAECEARGYKSQQIPSCQTVRNWIHMEKNS